MPAPASKPTPGAAKIASSAQVQTVRQYLLGLQQRIVRAVQAEGGQSFASDAWQRAPQEPLQGDGASLLIEDSTSQALIERGGCNFSHVRGSKLPPSATQHRPELAGAPFEALGVSLVMHPRNPHVPTVHMNVRMLIATPTAGEGGAKGASDSGGWCGEPGAAVAWFGGGIDLTPYYGEESDARHFHHVCAQAVAPFPGDLYARFKPWCDEYFYLKHRREPRGVGGIFFDDYADGGFEQGFALMQAVGDALLPAYMPIVQRRKNVPYGPRERDFQAYRRGRYVEFNLVWDRGTHFGLHGGGRTESILMSMPPSAAWRYDWKPQPGTPEAKLYTDFLRPRDWLGEAAKRGESAGAELAAQMQPAPKA